MLKNKIIMILEMVALSVVQVKKQQTSTCKFIAIL